MAVHRKAPKIVENISNIEEIINRGGSTKADQTAIAQDNDEVRFTLRLPKAVIQKIDEERKKVVGNLSRNQWILESICDKLSHIV